MKRAIIALCVLSLVLLGAKYFNRTPAKNPDPNHTHADFAVWIFGTKLNFTNEIYMSGSSTDEGTHPTEGVRKYIHLHDGNDDVLHMHKPGITLGEFVASLGLEMKKDCVVLDEYQMEFFHETLEAESEPDFADVGMFTNNPREICTNAKFQWQLFVNGEEKPFDPSYQPSDVDKILLTFNDGEADETQLSAEKKAMTDEACMYSKTCPWKGAPPTENCIADPEVPCVVQ